MGRRASERALLTLAIDSRCPGAHKRRVEAAPNRAQDAFGLAHVTGAALCRRWTSSTPAQTGERARNQRLRLDPSRQALVARLSPSASSAAQSGNSRVSVRIGGGGGGALAAGVRSTPDGNA